MSRRFMGFILLFPTRPCGEELFRDVLWPFTKLNVPSPLFTTVLSTIESNTIGCNGNCNWCAWLQLFHECKSGDIEQTAASVAARRSCLKRQGGLGLGLVLALTLAICAALTGCGSKAAKNAKASAPTPAVPVGVAAVKQGDFNVYLTGLGSVEAFYTVSLKTRIDGQIMQVNFREGQDV